MEVQKERADLKKRLAEQTEALKTAEDKNEDILREFRELRLDTGVELEAYKKLVVIHEVVCAQLEALREEHTEISIAYRRQEEELQRTQKELAYQTDLAVAQNDLSRHYATQVSRIQTEYDAIYLQLGDAREEITVQRAQIVETTKEIETVRAVGEDYRLSLIKKDDEIRIERAAMHRKVSILEDIVRDTRNLDLEKTQECNKLDGELNDAKNRAKAAVNGKDDAIRQLARTKEEVSMRDEMLKQKEHALEDLRIRGEQYQYALRNHDHEKIQLQAMLEGEREAHQEALASLEHAYEERWLQLTERSEMWKMFMEDTFSSLNFNPISEKVKKLERDAERSAREIVSVRRESDEKAKQVENLTQRLAALREESQQLQIKKAAAEEQITLLQETTVPLEVYETVCMHTEEIRQRIFVMASELSEDVPALKREVAHLREKAHNQEKALHAAQASRAAGDSMQEETLASTQMLSTQQKSTESTTLLDLAGSTYDAGGSDAGGYSTFYDTVEAEVQTEIQTLSREIQTALSFLGRERNETKEEAVRKQRERRHSLTQMIHGQVAVPPEMDAQMAAGIDVGSSNANRNPKSTLQSVANTLVSQGNSRSPPRSPAATPYVNAPFDGDRGLGALRFGSVTPNEPRRFRIGATNTQVASIATGRDSLRPSTGLIEVDRRSSVRRPSTSPDRKSITALSKARRESSSGSPPAEARGGTILVDIAGGSRSRKTQIAMGTPIFLEDREKLRSMRSQPGHSSRNMRPPQQHRATVAASLQGGTRGAAVSVVPHPPGF
jgi:hypothetical protein